MQGQRTWRSTLRRISARTTPLQPLGGMTPSPPPGWAASHSASSDINAGDPEGWPEVSETIRALVALVSFAALGERDAPGWATSGASESNLLALYWARENGYKRILTCDTAHYSVFKAARILGVKYEIVATRPPAECNVNELTAKIREKDVVVLTVGTTQEGAADPITETAEVAAAKGAVVHVDAAFAGLVARHTSPKASSLKLKWPIVTMSVDAHKIPEAPAPAGVLLAYSDDVIDSLFFEAPYIPGGRQFGVLGTRPGWTLRAAVEALASLLDPDRGSEKLASTLMARLREIIESLEPHGFRPVVEPETPIACLVGDGANRAAKRLSAAGLHYYSCPRHGGLRIAVKAGTRPDHIIRLLLWATSQAHA